MGTIVWLSSELMFFSGLFAEKDLKPCEDGMPLYEQMCHVHEVRYGWLSKVSPELAGLDDPCYRTAHVPSPCPAPRHGNRRRP